MLNSIPGRISWNGLVNRRGANIVPNGGAVVVLAGPYTVPAGDEHDIGEMSVGVTKGAQQTLVQLQYLPAGSAQGTAFTTVWDIPIGDYGAGNFPLDIPRFFQAGDQYQVVASAVTGTLTAVSLGGWAKLKDVRD